MAIPPPFKSISMGCNGQNGSVRWGVSCHTVQDLQYDGSGNTIYAVGTVSFNGPSGTSQVSLDNRGFSIINGTSIYTPPFYGIADAKACLQQLFTKLCVIGNQGS